MIECNPQIRPELDPGFQPAACWNRAFEAAAGNHPHKRDAAMEIARPDGQRWVRRFALLPDEAPFRADNLRYTERLLKTLLWAWGGSSVRISGAPEVVPPLNTEYAPGGERAFDHEFMGQTCFRTPFGIHHANAIEDPSARSAPPAQRSLSGCRIGFDLGGSDRKAAAVIDGEVVFSEEIPWDPYFQEDPTYHLDGIRDSLRRAAERLPRVDAIGGSAAGIYIDNEPRVASLFRGVSPSDFESVVRPIFRTLQQEWGNVPFEVANDGDVTALAGTLSLGANGLLGVSMGTSQAGGYTDRNGQITGWLNELAFVPVDYRPDAPRDEWSGDHGCGVQYFSQQAVARLIPAAGIAVSEGVPFPKQLEMVQAKIKGGDDRAAAIYRTIGTYFGYAIAQYSDLYDFDHVLFLGRVSSGEGGQLIQEVARSVLSTEFPELAERLSITMPDEQMKRHGQAVAAAALPTIPE